MVDNLVLFFLRSSIQLSVQLKDLGKTFLTSIDGCHTVDDRRLILLEVLNFFLEDLGHDLHVEHFDRLNESNSMLERYIPFSPDLDDRLICQMDIFGILVKLNRFIFDLLSRLLWDGGFLLAVERASTIFPSLGMIHSILTAMGS